MTEILNSNINTDVIACDNVEDAAEIFENRFKSILDKHAPVKIFQMRKHYSPYLSEKTKTLLKERNSLKEEATATGDKDAEKQAKKKGREIKKAMVEDKIQYYSKDFGEKLDSSSSWQTARVILGENNNLAPTAIKNTSENGEVEIVTNPKRLANIFNHFFINTFHLLRKKTILPPAKPLIEKLRANEEPEDYFVLLSPREGSRRMV